MAEFNDISLHYVRTVQAKGARLSVMGTSYVALTFDCDTKHEMNVTIFFDERQGDRGEEWEQYAKALADAINNVPKPAP